MSWRVMGAAYYPFGFVNPPEHLTVENDTTHETVRYLPERTCSMEFSAGIPEWYKDILGTFFCSECGSPIYNDMEPSFCIYCGAKVVRA